MARYRCPTCRDLPLRPLRLRGRPLLCARCGGELRRRADPLPGLAGLSLIAGLAVAAAAVPDPLAGLSALGSAPSQLPRLLARFETMPEPGERPLALLDRGLFRQLEQGDRGWLPAAQPLPGGGVRYVYRRRAGDPELDIAQIRALIADPPSYERERESIHRLLHVLDRARVRVLLAPPRKAGAAAEWDHAARTLRIKPDVPAKGSVDFARVLNHEAIHVAQSCSAGGLRSRPRVLGLPDDVEPGLRSQLDSPLYAHASGWERRLEKEAYANQHNLELGATLVASHCPLVG